MDQFGEYSKEQVGVLLRAVNLATFYKNDNVPCQIEEVAWLRLM